MFFFNLPIFIMLKFIKISELLILFIGVPVAFYLNLFPKYKLLALLIGLVYCLTILLSDKNFDRNLFKFNKIWWKHNYKTLLLRFLIVVIISAFSMYFFFREYFFYLLIHKPLLWLVIMIFYPIFSAIPQEIIYRTFYFYRYADIFKSPNILIIVNSFLFSIAHLMFNNYFALILTFAGSFMFATTYLNSKSTIIASIEHSIYGNWIFTVGIGKYFYVPVH